MVLIVSDSNRFSLPYRSIGACHSSPRGGQTSPQLFSTLLEIVVGEQIFVIRHPAAEHPGSLVAFSWVRRLIPRGEGFFNVPATSLEATLQSKWGEQPVVGGIVVALPTVEEVGDRHTADIPAVREIMYCSCAQNHMLGMEGQPDKKQA